MTWAVEVFHDQLGRPGGWSCDRYTFGDLEQARRFLQAAWPSLDVYLVKLYRVELLTSIGEPSAEELERLKELEA